MPQAGLIAANADAKAWFTPLTVLKVWDARSSEWRFASAITIPLLWLEAGGTVRTPLGARRIRQSNLGIYDIAITPFIIGHRLSFTLQASARLPIYAPTGSYAAGRLNNLSANYWTVAPTLALIRLSPDGTAELSGQLAVQVHSRNKATDYQSAPVLIFDALAAKRFASGLGAGVALSLVQQLGDDTGRLADRLGGFRGRDFGIGPYASYTTKVGAAPLDLTLRWVPSIESKRRLAGNTVMLTASMPVRARMPPEASPAAP